MIMKAIEIENAIVGVNYSFLPRDQIMGIVLKKLDIPSKLGGKIDWSKIG